MNRQTHKKTIDATDNMTPGMPALVSVNVTQEEFDEHVKREIARCTEMPFFIITEFQSYLAKRLGTNIRGVVVTTYTNTLLTDRGPVGYLNGIPVSLPEWTRNALYDVSINQEKRTTQYCSERRIRLRESPELREEDKH